MVPIRQAQRLYDALLQTGCDVTFIPIVDKSHNLSTRAPLFDPVSQRILAFFRQHRIVSVQIYG
ncbi:MAG: hypothetical protein NVS4B12_20470 [Ktedonobacteraceae bacterium]